jgi:hypothetical protein
MSPNNAYPDGRTPLPDGATMPPIKPAPNPRSYPEDLPDDNGNYQHCCPECNQTFFGHKLRVVCKLCSRRDQAMHLAHTAGYGSPLHKQPTPGLPEILVAAELMDRVNKYDSYVIETENGEWLRALNGEVIEFRHREQAAFAIIQKGNPGPCKLRKVEVRKYFNATEEVEPLAEDDPCKPKTSPQESTTA